MPPRHRRGFRNEFVKPKDVKKTLLRILSYLSGRYKFGLLIVFVCILIGSVTGVIGSLFLQVLIDDYIIPFIGSGSPNYSGMLTAVSAMAGIYLIGVLSSLLYSRIMVIIAQGVIKNVRDEMFSKMQGLPIKYFDTHPIGDTMSHFTNDTDTLHQMIGSSIPQMMSSLITITAVFAAMIYTSIYLTILVLCMVGIMAAVIKKIG
ncbi:MAG TPA: ABC transporter transmembrane domain-containing protein, partial [Methanocorpusculum sp.]|nr:ABC transporter transmembrane domain-containing protein [Methanocorpusculum sp.]